MVTKLDKLFRIPPTKRKTQDGSTDSLIIEHRIGREGGYFTTAQLMAKLGLEAEYGEWIRKNRKMFSDSKQFEMTCKSIYKTFKSKMDKAVSAYRAFLSAFYENQPRPLKPMLAFVPVSDKENGLYLQCLYDVATKKPVVWVEQEDFDLWATKITISTQGSYDLHVEAQQVARATLSLPGINKDIANRMKLIAGGQTPEYRLMGTEVEK